MKVALASWEIGRVQSGFGVKIGGLGAVLEELPAELVRAAADQGHLLEIELLSPCFAHYDRSGLRKLPLRLPAAIDGRAFEFEAYEHVFFEGVKIKSVYFWDPGQLGWTHGQAVYPENPWMGLKLYAAVSQAMAGYIRQGNFHTVHLHDYHVGLAPFYLGDEFLKEVPVHFTIHNASYQGVAPLINGGYSSVDRLNLPGEKLFHKYFDFFDTINPTKAVLLKVHENGGRITTVSGDLDGAWGYAAELRESRDALQGRAWMQKGAAPVEVFLPNLGLDIFEKIPAAGITNGLSAKNWPDRMPELRAEDLRALQAQSPAPLFSRPKVLKEMFAKDHNFDVEHLEMKQKLRRLLYLEAFGHEMHGKPVILCAVGRMAEQKNFALICAVMEKVLIHDPRSRFIVLASAQDEASRGLEASFFSLAAKHPGRICFNNAFNQPLSRLILAGSDFVLVPSRFEPCGLVDYEASLLGTIPIARAVGGLAKTRDFGYLYDWLDIGDVAGEIEAFFSAIEHALMVFHKDEPEHLRRVRAAMAVDASWERSAVQYIELYRYGLLAKLWRKRRSEAVGKFIAELGCDRELFCRYLAPGRKEYGDRLDWELKHALEAVSGDPA